MSIFLYTTNTSAPARSVLMTLEQIDLKVEFREVSVIAGDHLKPEYEALNILRTIPFLEDGDFKLSDSHAIAIYLVEKYGGDKKKILYPDCLKTKATIHQRMFVDASLVFPVIRDVFTSILVDKKSEPSEKQTVKCNNVYKYLEKYLEETKFLAADHLTLADLSLTSSITTLNGLIPIVGYPKLIAWLNTMTSFDFVKKANEPGMAEIVNFLKKEAEKNRN